MGFPDSSVGKESICNAGDPSSALGLERSTGEGIRLPTPVLLGFPCGSAAKESTCNVGNMGLMPGLGRFSGEGKGYPLQHSGLGNSMNCIVHGVAKSWTVTFTFTHSDTKTRQRYYIQNYRPLSFMYRLKNPQNTSKPNSTPH